MISVVVSQLRGNHGIKGITLGRTGVKVCRLGIAFGYILMGVPITLEPIILSEA